MPFPLLSQSISIFNFKSISLHARSRLTLIFFDNSADFHCVVFCYNMMSKLSSNHQESMLVMRGGLTTCEDKTGGLGLRVSIDPSMLEYIDAKSMVINICVHQLHHQMSHFLNFVCNMKKME